VGSHAAADSHSIMNMANGDIPTTVPDVSVKPQNNNTGSKLIRLLSCYYTCQLPCCFLRTAWHGTEVEGMVHLCIMQPMLMSHTIGTASKCGACRSICWEACSKLFLKEALQGMRSTP
jgi:hypothetical protein